MLGSCQTCGSGQYCTGSIGPTLGWWWVCPHCWFLPHFAILLWCFPILTVFLTTSCPFVPHFCPFPLFFHKCFPVLAVISSTIAPSRAQTSAFQYGPVPPSTASCPLQDSECDPGLQDDYSMVYSPIPVCPTTSQCLSTPPQSPQWHHSRAGDLGWGRARTPPSADLAVARPGVSPAMLTPAHPLMATPPM